MTIFEHVELIEQHLEDQKALKTVELLHDEDFHTDGLALHEQSTFVYQINDHMWWIPGNY